MCWATILQSSLPACIILRTPFSGNYKLTSKLAAFSHFVYSHFVYSHFVYLSVVSWSQCTHLFLWSASWSLCNYKGGSFHLPLHEYRCLPLESDHSTFNPSPCVFTILLIHWFGDGKWINFSCRVWRNVLSPSPPGAVTTIFMPQVSTIAISSSMCTVCTCEH